MAASTSSDRSVLSDEARVVMQGSVRFKGNLHSHLPRVLLSGPTYCALTSADTGPDSSTIYTLQLGDSAFIEIMGDMTLTPTLKQYTSLHTAGTGCIQLHHLGKTVSLTCPDEAAFKSWFKALREALAETIFRAAFSSLTQDGCLCAGAIQAAIDRSSSLVHAANCHVLRAHRLLDIIPRLHSFTRRVKIKPHRVSWEDATEILHEVSECDPLFAKDADAAFITHLLPRMLKQTELDKPAMSSRDTSQASHRILNTHLSELSPSLLLSTECREMDRVLPQLDRSRDRSIETPVKSICNSETTTGMDKDAASTVTDKENASPQRAPRAIVGDRVSDSAPTAQLLTPPPPQKAVSSSPLPSGARSAGTSRTARSAHRATNRPVAGRFKRGGVSGALVLGPGCVDNSAAVIVNKGCHGTSFAVVSAIPLAEDVSTIDVTTYLKSDQQNEQSLLRSVRLFYAMLLLPLLLASAVCVLHSLPFRVAARPLAPSVSPLINTNPIERMATLTDRYTRIPSNPMSALLLTKSSQQLQSDDSKWEERRLRLDEFLDAVVYSAID